MLNFIATWRREREAVRELSRLTDRELADLGLSRSDIPAVAQGAALAVRGEAAALTATRGTDVLVPTWAVNPTRSLAA